MTNSIDSKTSFRLRRFNLIMGVLHLVQGFGVLALTNDFALPVTATFLENAPGLEPPSVDVLFNLSIGWGVAVFLFMSAAAHFIIASPGVFPWYLSNLEKRRNYARWVEYAFSSSVMIVLIAMLTGISTIDALIGLFGVNAAMILFGLLMEKHEEPGSPSWLSFNFGSLTGAIPWIVIGIYIWSPGNPGSPPAFVYAIFVTLFIFFNTFALNMILQYRQVGKWSSYLYGERAYIFLSLFAKSALAWQVFGGTLAT